MTDSSPTSPTALDFLWRRVLELAARGRFSVSPNPRVGCVVVDSDGTVVGEGWHERAGGAHAEAAALAAAGERARGATLLVNLEPCSHFGRTAPCTEAILAAGIARVVCSLEDPDPRIAGRGIRRLRDRGVEVLVGAFAAEAERVNEPFLTSARERRPFVHLKWAASLDGKTGDPDGRVAVDLGRDGPARRAPPARGARRDPRRGGDRPGRRPAPDAPARPVDRRSCRTAGSSSTARCASRPRRASSRRPAARSGSSRPSRSGTRVSLRSGTAASTSSRGRLPSGGVDLAALLADLYAAEARSLLVEGGGVTAASFLAAGLVDRVTAYVAPKILGGVGARVPVAGEGVGSDPRRDRAHGHGGRADRRRRPPVGPAAARGVGSAACSRVSSPRRRGSSRAARRRAARSSRSSGRPRMRTPRSARASRCRASA